MNAMANMMLFSGNANLPLARKIAGHLEKPLGKALVSQFSDGEVYVELQESVRGRDVFIIQSTSFPVNDHLMELMALTDALRRASAKQITVVMPYFGYARQDKRPQFKRVSITAKVVADMLKGVGVHRVLTVDLYSDQIQGFFDIPIDSIYTTSIFARDIQRQSDNAQAVIVAPDAGSIGRSGILANQLNITDLVIIDKKRKALHPTEGQSITETLEGKHCIMLDDAVGTGDTLDLAARMIKQKGAAYITAYCTHAVLAGNAVERIQCSNLDKVIVTDTIPLSEDAKACQKIRVLSLYSVLAEAIRHIHCEESISDLF
jgi:ribose-phosphate pyrophosphokinase